MEETEVGSKASEQLAMRRMEMEMEERQREKDREIEERQRNRELEVEERQKNREFEERQRSGELELRNKELEHKISLAASQSTFDVSKRIRFVPPFQEKRWTFIFCISKKLLKI